MRQVYSALIVAVCIIATMMVFTVHGKDSAFDPRDYCGIPPAPAEIPALPKLSAKALALNPKLTDFYIFTRHGDRSTLTKKCWKNTQYKDRVWVECPHNTLGFHAGLLQRNPYAPSYAMPIHPLQDKQVLLGNCHLGQLTQRGLMMSYNNGLRTGKYLRDAFDARGSPLNPTKLKFRSTDVHRTRETAEGFITGLLDTMGGDPNVLQKQLPPLYFVDEKVDAQRLNTNVCNTGPYIDKVYASEEWKTYTQSTWDPLLKNIREALNEADAEMGDVFDCIKPFQCHEQPYPEALKQYANDVEAAMNQYWNAAYYHDPVESAQLFSGYLLLELSTLFSTSSIKSINEDPTAYLWSGHDFGSISNLATALLFPNFLWPPYSAMINVEFFRIPDQSAITPGQTSFVRFMYLGELIIPEFCTAHVVADELCPAEVVLNHIKSRLPSAEQCPGIPRMSYNFGEIKDAMIKAGNEKNANSPLLDSIDHLYQTIAKLDHDLEVVQEAILLQQPQEELSHHERWSKFN